MEASKITAGVVYEVEKTAAIAAKIYDTQYFNYFEKESKSPKEEEFSWLSTDNLPSLIEEFAEKFKDSKQVGPNFVHDYRRFIKNILKLAYGEDKAVVDNLDSLSELAALDYHVGPAVGTKIKAPKNASVEVDLPAIIKTRLNDIDAKYQSDIGAKYQSVLKPFIDKLPDYPPVDISGLGFSERQLVYSLKGIIFGETDVASKYKLKDFDSFYESDDPMVAPAVETLMSVFVDIYVPKCFEKGAIVDGTPKHVVNFLKQAGVIVDNDFLLKPPSMIAKEAGYDINKLSLAKSNPNIEEGEDNFVKKLQELRNSSTSGIKPPESVIRSIKTRIEKYKEALEFFKLDPDSLKEKKVLTDEQVLTAIGDPGSLPEYKFGKILKELAETGLISYDKESKTYIPNPVTIEEREVPWFSDLDRLGQIYGTGKLTSNILDNVLQEFAKKRAAFNSLFKQYDHVYTSWLEPVQKEMKDLGEKEYAEKLEKEEKELQANVKAAFEAYVGAGYNLENVEEKYKPIVEKAIELSGLKIKDGNVSWGVGKANKKFPWVTNPTEEWIAQTLLAGATDLDKQIERVTKYIEVAYPSPKGVSPPETAVEDCFSEYKKPLLDYAKKLGNQKETSGTESDAKEQEEPEVMEPVDEGRPSSEEG